MLDEQLAEALVAVLVGRHQRREIVLLAGVRVGAVLEQQLRELVARVGIARRRRAVQRHHLHVVPRRGVDLRPTLDEQPGRLDVAEEAREAERLKPVLGPRVREAGVLVEQLSKAVGPPDGGRFEDVELGIRSEQLLGPRLVPP